MNRDELHRSRDAFLLRPSFATPLQKLPPNKEGEAERRQAPSQEPRHTSRRYRLPMLRARRAPRSCDVAAATRFGRARLSALRRGFPRAALGCTRFGPGRASREREDTGVTRSSFAPKPCTRHPGRITEGVDTRTARERSVSLRPQEPHSLHLTGAPSRKASLRSETAPPSNGRAGGVNILASGAQRPLISRRFLIVVFAI